MAERARAIVREGEVGCVRSDGVSVAGDEQTDRGELPVLADRVADQLEALLELRGLRSIDVEGPALEVHLFVGNIDAPREEIDAAEEAVRIDRFDGDPKHCTFGLLPLNRVLAAVARLS